MAAKRPSFQFYSADWLKDPAVRAVSLTARGLWFDMLCLMDQSPSRGFLQLSSGQPISPDQLARMTGCSPEEVSRLLQELETAGVYSARRGIIYSRRMVRDEEARQVFSAAGKKGGGNPALKQKPPAPPSIGGYIPPNKGVPEEEDEGEVITTLMLEEIYGLYPKKVGRADALKAIRIALGKVKYKELREAVGAYAAARKGQDPQFTPHPGTWFRQERWKDDRATWKPASGVGQRPADASRVHTNGPSPYDGLV